MEQHKHKFVSWIKCRIGQPLTALQISKDRVFFGSISGYTGFLNLQNGKVSYFQQVDEQLIRGIYYQNQKIYIAIGDKYIRIKDLVHDSDNDEMLSVLRTHSNIVCSHSMTMMHGFKIIIFCAFPTQKKQALSVQLEIQTKNLYQIDAKKNQIKLHRQFKMPQVAVPFDYDGTRILWMEYMANQTKQFQYFDLIQKKVYPIKSFDKQYHFLSHGKLVGKQLIFVQNNKNVKTYHIQSKVQRDLYSHNSSIIAFSISNRESADYSIISVDFNGVFTLWRSNAIGYRFNLWQVGNVPKQIKKHQYLFDMGYAYYIKYNDGILAITTDLGMMVFSL